MLQPRDGIAAPFTEAGLKAHIAATPQLARHFPCNVDGLTVSKIGAGDLNLVFSIQGGGKTLAIKQALPISRMSKGARASGSERLGFEAHALRTFAEFSHDHVPVVVHYEPQRSLLAQTLLSPTISLRKGLLAGNAYPQFADQISSYLANCLYGTSALGMETARRRPLIAFFAGNTELCETTERLVFTEPFRPSPGNRWTSPQLDAYVAALQGTGRLQMRVRDLKHRFLTRTEALLHGGLHSGSILMTAESMQVIDPEFATFGPMGFDIGVLLGHLMLGHFARAARGGDGVVPHMVQEIWHGFADKFRAMALSGSGLLGAPDSNGDQGFRHAREEWLDAFLGEVLQDTIGFAAVEMIRRTIGAAQVEDFEGIADANLRASCEKAALGHAMDLLTRRGTAGSIDVLTDI